MLINAFNLATPTQRAELTEWIQKEQFDKQEKIEAVTALYNAMGIEQLAKDKIAYYFEESKKYLEAVKLPADRKQELLSYANQLMNRVK